MSTGDAAVEREPIITFEASVPSDANPDVVYDLLADPATHLEWAGDQAPDKRFRLLTLEAPKGAASVGTTFSSTGASSTSDSGAMTFHDQSTVTVATRPVTFGFQTDSTLVRKRRPAWHARFVHHYTVASHGTASRIDYRCAVHPINYRPYWLHPLLRPATRWSVERAMRKNMENLARMAERSVAAL